MKSFIINEDDADLVFKTLLKFPAVDVLSAIDVLRNKLVDSNTENKEKVNAQN